MTDKLREAALWKLLTEAREALWQPANPDLCGRIDEALAQQDAQTVDFDDAYASTTMALVEDYAKAVHDGDDAACSVLRQTIKASLEQAAPTPPAQRGCSSTSHVGLTDEEVIEVWTDIALQENGSGWHAIGKRYARAIIEAYETKNGINRG